MRASTATSLDLQSGDFRIDGSYHTSYGIQIAKSLKKWEKATNGKLDTLGSVAYLFNGPRFPRNYVEEPGIGISFLSSSDMLLADLSNIKYLSKKHTPTELLEKIKIQQGWTLISCSGTIGNTVYVRKDMAHMTGSQHIMRAVPKDGTILSGYLYAFLSSEIAYSLLTQGTYGAVIQHIEPQHIENLPIPRLGPAREDEIHRLIERAAELRVQANKLIGEAREQLLSVNKLRKLTPEDYYFYGNYQRFPETSGTFLISSRELSSLTINAWNYADKFINLRKRIMAGSCIKFSEAILPNGYYSGRSFKRIPMPTGDGIELIGQKNLFGIRKVGKWISQAPIASVETELITDGAILLAGVGTNAETEVFGRCELVWKNFLGKVPAAEIIRINADPRKIDPGYFYTFLSSDYGFRLLRSTITGTKLCRFIEPLVMDLPIPIPDNKHEMIRIGDKVRMAYDNRARAIELEDRAQNLLASNLV